MKSAMGFTKKPEGKGNKLGYAIKNSKADTFTVQFEGELGFIVQQEGIAVYVIEVTEEGGVAHLEGVRSGDRILSIDGNEIVSLEAWDMCISIRPCIITFTRLLPNDNNGSQKDSSSDKKVPSLSRNSSDGGSSQSGSGKRVTGSGKVGGNSSNEDAREARLKAIREREAKNNKFIKGGSKKGGASAARSTNSRVIDDKDRPVYDHSMAASHNNAETMKLVNATKAMEMQTAEDMGYNPFQPHMSSSSSPRSKGGAS
jgi:hypothetical protein